MKPTFEQSKKAYELYLSGDFDVKKFWNILSEYFEVEECNDCGE